MWRLRPPTTADDELHEAFELGYGRLILQRAPAHLEESAAAAVLKAADPEMHPAMVVHALAHRRFAATGERRGLTAYYAADDLSADSTLSAVDLGQIRLRMARIHAAAWQFGTIVLRGAPAELSESAAREIVREFAEACGVEVSYVLARRRFVLTGDLAAIDD